MFYTLFGKIVYSADASGEALNQEIPIPDMPAGDYGAAIVKMFLTLFALIALLFGTYWFLRRLIQSRMSRGGPAQSIRVLEKRMISPKSILYLVEVEGQKVLLAESQLEVRRLQSWQESVVLAEETQDASK